MSSHLSDIIRPGTGNEATDRRLFLRVLLYALLFKLFVVSILPLGVDEAYAVAVAQHFSLSFFDHPPISFWLPVAFARISGIESAFIYRLPFLISGVLTTGVMYLLGRELAGSRAGLWTAFLFAAAPFFLVSAGFLVVPDGTLSLGLAATALFLVKIAKQGDRAPLSLWVWTGLALALALGSKYQAAWTPVAVLLFMAITPQGRRWFLQPGPWLGAAIGALGLLPVILWNAQNDWISFSFHTSRAGDGFTPQNLLLMLAGQALFLLPPTLVVALIGLWQAFKRPIQPERLLLALLALGPILIFNYVYLTSRTSHAHWTMPGWQFALPLAGAWLAGRPEKTLRRFYRWSGGMLIVIWLPLVVLAIHARTGFLTKPFYAEPPKWDYTLSLFDFGGLKAGLKKRGLWDKTDVLMADSWSWGGIVDTALGLEKPMRIIDAASAHHFQFLPEAKATGRALYLMPTLLSRVDAAQKNALQKARAIDPEARLLAPIILERGRQPYVAVIPVQLRLG